VTSQYNVIFTFAKTFWRSLFTQHAYSGAPDIDRQAVPSPRGALVGLAHPNKAPRPKLSYEAL